MRLDDVITPLRGVDGYPQMRMIEPAIDQLTEIAERFTGIDMQEDRSRMGESLVWLFANFVRDADGQPFEGVDTPEQALRKVKPSMIAALTKAVTPEGDDPLDPTERQEPS